jgi:lipopolysaccharide/colanic/teichoic acid biosynthesis glycosyltransferase
MYRLFEIVAASTGLVIAAPLMAVIAVLIKLESSGPIIFRQTRVGRGGKDFVFWKFRTMTVQPGPATGRFDPRNRQRITRVGRILRSSKLDELPQLFHVLTGTMSLVGPRPPLRRWVEAYPQRWAKVLTMRPGITHPAAIEFRDEEELLAAATDPLQLYHDAILPHKLDLYEHYQTTRTGWTDIKVLLQTARVLLVRRRRADSMNAHTEVKRMPAEATESGKK